MEMSCGGQGPCQPGRDLRPRLREGAEDSGVSAKAQEAPVTTGNNVICGFLLFLSECLFSISLPCEKGTRVLSVCASSASSASNTVGPSKYLNE